MPDPGKGLVAGIRYEIRIIAGPYRLRFRTEDLQIDAGADLTVLMRMTLLGHRTIEEVVVGIIGSEFRYETRESVNLVAFLRAGGVIGLSRDLQ